MRNFQVRSDGPPDYEWLGSFDNFQTEFSISQLVEEKFTSTNTGSPKFCPHWQIYNRGGSGEFGACDCSGNLQSAKLRASA